MFHHNQKVRQELVKTHRRVFHQIVHHIEEGCLIHHCLCQKTKRHFAQRRLKLMKNRLKIKLILIISCGVPFFLFFVQNKSFFLRRQAKKSAKIKNLLFFYIFHHVKIFAPFIGVFCGILMLFWNMKRFSGEYQ